MIQDLAFVLLILNYLFKIYKWFQETFTKISSLISDRDMQKKNNREKKEEEDKDKEKEEEDYEKIIKCIKKKK